MAKREFSYRGLNIEELKALSMDELVNLFPARMRRVLKRGLTPEQTMLLKKIRKIKKTFDQKSYVKPIKTHLRNMPIFPEMVGMAFGVHNGGLDKGANAFTQVKIEPEMIGHYLGEFAMTRKGVKHTGPGVGATRSSKFISVR